MDTLLINCAKVLLPIAILFTAFTSRAEEFSLSDEVIELTYEYYTEDVSAELLQSVIWMESRGNTDAVSSDQNNIGLMQLHILYFYGDLYDPHNNVKQGADYLQSLIERYGDVATALMVYHGESNAVQKGKDGNISNYAKTIIELSESLRTEETEWTENYTKSSGKFASVSMRKQEKSLTLSDLKPLNFQESRELSNLSSCEKNLLRKSLESSQRLMTSTQKSTQESTKSNRLIAGLIVFALVLVLFQPMDFMK